MLPLLAMLTVPLTWPGTVFHRCAGASTVCLDSNFRCNGAPDCPGGDDEFDCPIVTEVAGRENLVAIQDGLLLPEFKFLHSGGD